MKNSPYALQSHPDAGALSLCYVSTKPSKQFLNVRPGNIGPDRLLKYTCKRLALLFIHEYLISLVNIMSRQEDLSG